MEGRSRFEDGRRATLRWLADGRLLLALGALCLAYCLLSPAPRGDWDFREGFRQVGALLRGSGSLGDVSQDVVGFRRLMEGRDPYPVLGPALQEIGVDWAITHTSTHPPTAYLFAAPIAYVPLGLAGQLWCGFGFLLLFLAARCYGAPWRAALGLALLAPVWRPMGASFQNLTLVWLCGVAIAFRYRDGAEFMSGLGMGLASMPKPMPAGLTLYFVLRRKGAAILSFFAMWIVALALLRLIAPGVWSAYLGPGVRTTTWATILRPDNSALLPAAYTTGGTTGLVLAGIWLAGLLLRNAGVLLRPDRSPEYAFFLYSFLAMALLPIAWGYSVAPLLPILAYFLVRGRPLQVALAGATVLTFGFLYPFGREVALGTAGASVLFWLAPPEEPTSVSPARPARCPGR